LAEAGYPGGRGIDGLAILYNGEGAHGEIAQAIRRNWQMELGVTVGLEQVETRMYRERRKNKAFSIARAGWYGDYHDPTTFLDMFDSRNVGNNDSGWANARYDGLLDQAAVETDPVRRMMLLRQGEVLLLQEQPVLPIYQYTNLNLFDPRKVHGLVPNAWNERRLELVDVTRD
jgi:oligopeptide transport system substrate-binding protein